NTEAADFLCGKNCHFGDLVRARFDVDISVCEEEGATLRDEQAQGGIVSDTGNLADNLPYDTEVAFEATFKTADHGVCFVAHNRESGNCGRVRADDGACSFRCDALPAGVGQIKV